MELARDLGFGFRLLRKSPGFTTRSFLFGVSAHDPLAFGVSAVVLVATALAASYLPARRASRADPWSTLRAE
jgi:ABC-type lipoprotein release transport system permease subunit